MSGPGWDFSQYVDDGQGASGRPAGPPPTGPVSAPPPLPGPAPAAFPGAGLPAAGGPYAGPGVLTGDPYAMPDSSGIELATGRPPVVWLVAAAVAAVAGGLLAWLLGATPLWAVVAWAISGPVAIGLLAVFSGLDTRQRAKGIYAGADWVTPAYWVALVLCLLAVIGSAIRIALWIGRL